jgi:hypothetical protein
MNDFWLDKIRNREVRINKLSEHLKTPEICLEAVKLYSPDIKYVPEELRTEEICNIALSFHLNFEFIPKKFITYEMCLGFIKQGARILEHIPKELMTEELCSEAIKNSLFSLQFLPEEFQTNELCFNSIKRDVRCFKYIKNPSQEVIDFYELMKI